MRRGVGHLLLVIGAVWLASGGCAQSVPPAAAPDAIRAARAIAWEPTVSEHLNRVDALSGDIAKSEASKDPAEKASVAEHTRRKALAIQEAGREFKRVLTEFVERLEKLAA